MEPFFAGIGTLIVYFFFPVIVGTLIIVPLLILRVSAKAGVAMWAKLTR